MIRDYWKGRRRLLVWAIAALLGYLAVAPATGCNRYAGIAAGYRGTILVGRVGSEAARVTAEWLRDESAKCRGTGDASAIAECKAPKIATAKRIRDALHAAALVNDTAVSAIRSVHLGISKGDPIKIAAASVCGLAKALAALAIYVDRLKPVVEQLRRFEGVICAIR